MLIEPRIFAIVWVVMAVILPIIPAYILFKYLPASANVEGPFHGMQIKLGGAFAAYFIVFITIILYPRPSDIEVWTVTGTVLDHNEEPPAKVDFSFSPSAEQFDATGYFILDIPIKRKQDGKENFPKILITRPGQAFGAASVKLAEKNPDRSSKTIDVGTLKLGRPAAPEVPYNSNPPGVPPIQASPSPPVISPTTTGP